MSLQPPGHPLENGLAYILSCSFCNKMRPKIHTKTQSPVTSRNPTGPIFEYHFCTFNSAVFPSPLPEYHSCGSTSGFIKFST